MGIIISLAHQKGGVGKSTIAYNLAIELNKRYKVKVIDFDFQKALTILNYAREPEKQFEMEEIKNFDKVDFYKDTNNKTIYIADLVGGFDSDINREVIAFSDLIITPVSAESLIDVYGLDHFKNILDTIKKYIPDTFSYVLCNRTQPQTIKNIEGLRKYVEENQGYFKMLKTVIRYRSDYYKAYNYGKSVVEYAPYSFASREIKSLIKEIEEILNLKEGGYAKQH